MTTSQEHLDSGLELDPPKREFNPELMKFSELKIGQRFKSNKFGINKKKYGTEEFEENTEDWIWTKIKKRHFFKDEYINAESKDTKIFGGSIAWFEDDDIVEPIK